MKQVKVIEHPNKLYSETTSSNRILMYRDIIFENVYQVQYWFCRSAEYLYSITYHLDDSHNLVRSYSINQNKVRYYYWYIQFTEALDKKYYAFKFFYSYKDQDQWIENIEVESKHELLQKYAELKDDKSGLSLEIHYYSEDLRTYVTAFLSNWENLLPSLQISYQKYVDESNNIFSCEDFYNKY